MGRTSFARWPCSIARAMDLVGDPWTPLIVREAFYGYRRFEEFQRELGIARLPAAPRRPAGRAGAVPGRRPVDRVSLFEQL